MKLFKIIFLFVHSLLVIWKSCFWWKISRVILLQKSSSQPSASNLQTQSFASPGHLVTYLFSWSLGQYKRTLEKTGACRYTYKDRRYTCKTADYLRIEEKFYTANGCLWFPQVTGRSLPAPANTLREAFIVPIRVYFITCRDVFVYPIPNNLTRVTSCCLWRQW